MSEIDKIAKAGTLAIGITIGGIVVSPEASKILLHYLVEPTLLNIPRWILTSSLAIIAYIGIILFQLAFIPERQKAKREEEAAKENHEAFKTEVESWKSTKELLETQMSEKDNEITELKNTISNLESTQATLNHNYSQLVSKLGTFGTEEFRIGQRLIKPIKSNWGTTEDNILDEVVRKIRGK